MAKQMPAVLKNFNVRVDGDSYAGTAKTINLPEIVKKTEEKENSSQQQIEGNNK